MLAANDLDVDSGNWNELSASEIRKFNSDSWYLKLYMGIAEDLPSSNAGGGAYRAKNNFIISLPSVASLDRRQSKRNAKSYALEFKENVVRSLLGEYHEFGKKSSAEVLVESEVLRGELNVGEILADIYLENSSNEGLLVGLLSIVAHLESRESKTTLTIMAISAFSHKSVQVRECAVRVFEYWAEPDSVNVLSSFELTPAWLDEYRLQVIRDLEVA